MLQYMFLLMSVVKCHFADMSKHFSIIISCSVVSCIVLGFIEDNIKKFSGVFLLAGIKEKATAQ